MNQDKLLIIGLVLAVLFMCVGAVSAADIADDAAALTIDDSADAVAIEDAPAVVEADAATTDEIEQVNENVDENLETLEYSSTSVDAANCTTLRDYSQKTDNLGDTETIVVTNDEELYAETIPDAEKKRLVSGVAAQYESEVIYNSIQDDLKEQGGIFTDTDTAVREYPEIMRKWFGKVIPSDDNKFSALNTAAWSGGSFVYVPKGVHVKIPLQAYFRINTPNMGQFERTLIIADEGSYVHYVEGCTAPLYSTDSLHSGVVEIVVEKNARVRYTTVQNWSDNVYNLVTQRAYVREGGTMEWVDGNIGSKATMKYPACILAEPYAKATTMSLGFAGEGQYQDTGAKMIHLAPHTSSQIVSKSISRSGGRAAYRGLVKVVEGAYDSSSSVVCDALLVDDCSRSDTYPHVDIREDNVSMAHEATVSKVSEDQLFYLMSRGLSDEEAMGMIVRGFVEPIARELPMEYALELNRLVELQMEGSVG